MSTERGSTRLRKGSERCISGRFSATSTYTRESPGLFQTVSEDEFSEVHSSKRPIRSHAKHPTTAYWYPCSVEKRRLGAFRCTNVYQGVATRNDATTREFRGHRT